MKEQRQSFEIKRKPCQTWKHLIWATTTDRMIEGSSLMLSLNHCAHFTKKDNFGSVNRYRNRKRYFRLYVGLSWLPNKNLCVAIFLYRVQNLQQDTLNCCAGQIKSFLSSKTILRKWHSTSFFLEFEASIRPLWNRNKSSSSSLLTSLRQKI